MAGEDATISEAMTELMKMLGLAVVFIYLIMVSPSCSSFVSLHCHVYSAAGFYRRISGTYHCRSGSEHHRYGGLRDAFRYYCK